MLRRRILVLLSFMGLVLAKPATAQAFAFTTLSFAVPTAVAEQEATSSSLPTLTFSDSSTVDVSKEATDSAAISEAFLKEYFVTSMNPNETTKESILPLSPIDVKGVSTYFSSVHLGIDIRADIGSPIMALRDGVVSENSYEAGGYGHYVVIEHTQGNVHFRSLYAHLKSSSVKLGQVVHVKDVIGYVGISGRSTGPHLHFETRVCAEDADYYTCVPIDPIRYLSKGIPTALAKK